MSAAPATVEMSLTTPPAKLTFAERFRWLGIVANGILVGAMTAWSLGFNTPRFGASALESIVYLVLFAGTAFFAVNWSAFVQWRRVRDAWAGLLIPVMFYAAVVWLLAVVDPVAAREFSIKLPEGSTAMVLTCAWTLGILLVSGVRLLDRHCLATSWQRGQFSLRTMVVLTLLTAVYACLARDFATTGPITKWVIGWRPNNSYGRYPGLIEPDFATFVVITSHAAIFAFALSLTGRGGWIFTVLIGCLLYGLSERLNAGPFALWFNFEEPKHVLCYAAAVVLFTSAMTLPWLLIGWRVVWTPPLWDRSWRKPDVAAGDAT